MSEIPLSLVLIDSLTRDEVIILAVSDSLMLEAALEANSLMVLVNFLVLPFRLFRLASVFVANKDVSSMADSDKARDADEEDCDEERLLWIISSSSSSSSSFFSLLL